MSVPLETKIYIVANAPHRSTVLTLDPAGEVVITACWVDLVTGRVTYELPFEDSHNMTRYRRTNEVTVKAFVVSEERYPVVLDEAGTT